MEPLPYDPERLKLLDASLQALLTTLQPSPESDAARRKVVAEMQAAVADALPQELHCSVETFGSFRAGLHLPGSDIDFAVTAWVNKTARVSTDDSFGDEQQQQQQVVHEVHDWPPLEQQHLLADLADALEAKGLVQGQVERVLHARVPLIKCIHKGTGLACDFSISRPECAFKAEMQKLLSSIDRRYSALYRLVKLWAAVHGLNDAASNTLNSWSWGLMVAYCLQCEQPGILPPLWQLQERRGKRAPGKRSARILQTPGVNAAALKRAVNKAAVGAGAFTSKRNRAGAEAVNKKSLGELLAGFFELFAEQMLRWVEGLDGGRRCSTWYGRWVDAAWPTGKPYIFGIEDPFHSEDNTARSVGTHNHLSCVNSAQYIAWVVAASAKLLRDALAGQAAAAAAAAAAAEDEGDAEAVTPTVAAAAALLGAPTSPGGVSLTDWLGGTGSTGSTAAVDGSTGSTSAVDSAGSAACSDTACQQMLTAIAWLFGPTVVLQQQLLPAALQLQLQQQIPAADLANITTNIASHGDVLAALGNSSSLGCSDSNNSCLSDPTKVHQIQQVLQVFQDMLGKLRVADDLVVCMGDYQRLRKQQLRQRWERQQQQQLQEGMAGLRVGSAPANLQRQQQQQQQRQRGRGGPRQHRMQQPSSREMAPASDAISAALRPNGAMRRQDSSSNSWGVPAAVATALQRAHSAAAIPPATGASGFRHESSDGFNGNPGEGSRREASGNFSGGRGSSSTSISRGQQSIPVPTGCRRRHDCQGRGSSRHAPADDSIGNAGTDSSRGDGVGALSSTAPAAVGLMERGRGRSRGRSSADNPQQQQHRQQEGRRQQQHAPPVAGGFAAAALSRAGLTGGGGGDSGVHAAAGAPVQQQQQGGRSVGDGRSRYAVGRQHGTGVSPN